MCSTVTASGLDCATRVRLYYTDMDEVSLTLSYEVSVHPTHFTQKEEAP